MLYIIIFLIAMAIIMSIFRFILSTTINLAVFSADILIVFIIAVLYFHRNISFGIANGSYVFLVDIIGGLIAVFIYRTVFRFLMRCFPLLGSILNFAVVGFVVYWVFPFLIKLITSIINRFNPDVMVTSQLHILKDPQMNSLLYYAVIIMLSVYIWRKRMDALR